MIKKILLCLAFALLVSTVAICVAQPPNVPGDTSSGQPSETSGKLVAGEPPAIPTDYSVGAPPKEKSIKSTLSEAEALYSVNPGLVLESWDASTGTWTQNPIKLKCSNGKCQWWYKLTNPVNQNAWFDFGSGWVPNNPNPMLAGTNIKSVTVNSNWHYIIVWGSQSAYSNPIWLYCDCNPIPPKLVIKITKPANPGPAPKTVTIAYNVNLDCTVRFMVNMPDGPNIDSGQMSANKGNNIWTYDDPGPTKTTTGIQFAGDREVVGFAWTPDDSAVNNQAYSVN